MTLTQSLIKNFSNKSKTYKDNFFHFSHGDKPWEIGLAYSFGRAAKTLDGVVAYLQNPTFDFAAITTFALNDLRDAWRAQEALGRIHDYDDYPEDSGDTPKWWPAGVVLPEGIDRQSIVARARQEVAADLKIIGLRSFQRATRQKHEWGERTVASGFGSAGITQTLYRSDVQVADLLTNNAVHAHKEERAEALSLAGFALVVVGTPLLAIAHHYQTESSDNIVGPLTTTLPAPATP